MQIALLCGHVDSGSDARSAVRATAYIPHVIQGVDRAEFASLWEVPGLAVTIRRSVTATNVLDANFSTMALALPGASASQVASTLLARMAGTTPAKL